MADGQAPLFTRKNALALFFALAMAAGAAVLFHQFAFLQNIGYAEIFAVSLLSSATILLPLPGFALVFAAAPYLNPFLLGIAAGLGSGLGEISGYLVGFAGHNAVERTRIFRSHKKQIKKYGAPSVFILALIPNPAFDMAGIAAGAMKMRWWEFLAATVGGKTIRYILLAYAGNFSAGWF